MKATKRELTEFLLTRVAVNASSAVRNARSWRSGGSIRRTLIRARLQQIRTEFRDIRDAVNPAAWLQVIKEARTWTRVAKDLRDRVVFFDRAAQRKDIRTTKK